MATRALRRLELEPQASQLPCTWRESSRSQNPRVFEDSLQLKTHPKVTILDLNDRGKRERERERERERQRERQNNAHLVLGALL
jgi:hypothetical protein